MRSASTQDRTDIITRKLKSSNCKAHAVLEWDNNGTWEYLEDLDGRRGITWKKSAKSYKYANFALTPLASTIGFSVLNLNGKFSPGSGTDYSDVLDLDTKVRLRGGYLLDDSTTETSESVALNSVYRSYNFYTKYNSSGYVELDADNSGGKTDIYFKDLFTPYYDSETYDDSTYSPDAYFVQTYDSFKKGYVDFSQFTIACNNTEGDVYYRTFNDRDREETINQNSTDWTSAGATVNGTKTVAVSGDKKRFLQVAVVYDGVAWADDLRITDVTVYYEPYVEWLYYDVFYLDTPSYSEPKEPNIPMLSCKGRDIFKRAIETDMNLSDLSGSVAITQLIKDICDAIGIQYTATSIVDLSAFSNRTLATGLEDVKKAADIFDLIMQIINQTGSVKYQMYMEYDSSIDDNVLFVQPKPSTYEAAFVFNYEHFESIGDKRRNYDKLLKRITVVSDNQVFDAEQQLASFTYNTAGTKTLSWANNAEAKRFLVVVNSGDGVVSLVSVEPKSMQFIITGTSIDVSILIYGNEWNTDPTFEGEWIDYDNMVNNNGITTRFTNPLVLTDNECRDIAKGYIEDFGTPIEEANTLKYPYLNLLLEQNDMSLLWARYAFIDDLYFITGMTYNWNISANPGDSTLYNLDDSGLNFSDISDFIYDDIMDYDKGYVYDMVHGVDATEAEAIAAYVPRHNIAIT